MGVFQACFSIGGEVGLPPGESFTPVQLLIRASGTLAFLKLSFLLCNGPMARLTPRFKPFLYNRRHLGVATFVIALLHGGLVTLWYHGFGVLNPLVSLLVSNPRYDSVAGFPFETLGLLAPVLLFLLAATSHDFWNANLGPGPWKSLHLSVYAAYFLLVAHVALGVLQSNPHVLLAPALAAAVAVVAGLQLATAFFARGPAQQDALMVMTAGGRAHGPGLLGLVGDPVRLSGRVYRRGDSLLLDAPLAAIQRV